MIPLVYTFDDRLVDTMWAVELERYFWYNTYVNVTACQACVYSQLSTLSTHKSNYANTILSSFCLYICCRYEWDGLGHSGFKAN